MRLAKSLLCGFSAVALSGRRFRGAGLQFSRAGVHGDEPAETLSDENVGSRLAERERLCDGARARGRTCRRRWKVK